MTTEITCFEDIYFAAKLQYLLYAGLVKVKVILKIKKLKLIFKTCSLTILNKLNGLIAFLNVFVAGKYVVYWTSEYF